MNLKELLKQIIITFQNSLPVPVYKRNLTLPLHSHKIVTVPGVRRCGKSSLFMLAINNLLLEGVDASRILFLNFDEERLSFESTEFDTILQAYCELFPQNAMNEVYIFFDEIQVTTGWESFVRRVYDNETKNIFITGSNSKMLSSEIATSLRGRSLQFEEFNLSFDEYCHFKKIDTNYYNTAQRATILNHFYEYLKHGGFPEIALCAPEHRDPIIQEYFFVMFYKDLVEHYNIINPGPIRYFIKRVLANITKPTSINKIYNEMKSQGVIIGKNTLYEVTEQTEAIYLLFPLSKYEPSLIKESNAPKKYYCIDNGLRSALIASPNEDLGVLLENMVFLHLRRNHPFQRGMYYYKNKKECDFLLTDKMQVTELIQVCWDLTDEKTKKREIDGLLEASQAHNCHKLTIITAELETEIHAEGEIIQVIPAWKWMLPTFAQQSKQ